MNRYLLDTNVISEARKNKPHGGVAAWLSGLRDEDIFLSAVTFGELQIGVERTRRQNSAKARELERWIEALAATRQVLGMDERCFRDWARLMIGRSDDLATNAMIAATARVHGLTVATRNESDFKLLEVELFNPFR